MGDYQGCKSEAVESIAVFQPTKRSYAGGKEHAVNEKETWIRDVMGRLSGTQDMVLSWEDPRAQPTECMS